MRALLFLLCALALLLSPIRDAAGYGSYVNRAAKTLGPYQWQVYWNPNDSTTNPTLHLGTSNVTLVGSGPVVGQMTMVRTADGTTPAVADAVALKVDSNTIIIGPRGCDSPDGDPRTAFVNSNCAQSGSQAYSNMINVLQNWWAPFFGENRDFCTSNDFMSCLADTGVHIIRPNTNTFVIQDSPPPWVVFFAQAFVLVGVTGIYATERGTAFVDMVRPQLWVSQTNCTFSALESMAGVYNAFPYDAYTGMGPDVALSANQAYNAAGTTNLLARVLVRRNPQQPDSFWVEFASAAGVGVDSHYFVPLWISQQSFELSEIPIASEGLDGSQSIASAFQQHIILALSLTKFFGVDALGHVDYTRVCSANFSWLYDAQAKPTLNPYKQYDSTNWFYEPQPAPWQLAIGSYRFCALNEFGYLAYPWCPFGQLRGSELFGEWPTLPYARLNRTADVGYAPYSLSCDQVYPTAPCKIYNPRTGQNDGAEWVREDLVLGLCFAPLMLPALVAASVSPHTAAQDCSRRQMRCYDTACLVCYRPLAMAFCKVGWQDYDEWCYRKFDATQQGQYLVLPSETAAACASMDLSLPTGASQAYVFQGSPYDEEFLYEFTLTPPLNPQECYQLTNADGTYVCVCSGEFIPCVTSVQNFPLCRYHQSQFLVAGRFQSIPPETVRMFRDGESHGTAPRGIFTMVRPLSGSTGEIGETPTCPANLTTIFSPGGATNNTALQFQGICSVNGACDQWNSERCVCNQYYSPVAYTPGYPQQYPELAACPCCCPATTEIGGRMSANSLVFTDAVSYRMCAGADYGNCVWNNATGTGVCECFPVANTDPLAETPFTPARGGLACACVVNKRMPYGLDPNWQPVTEDVCNNQGTCCPIGVTESDGTGIIAGGSSSQICYPNGASKPTTGCVCFNGRTGQGCAAVAPFNVASGLPVISTVVPNVAFVALGEATIVTAVQLTHRDVNMFAGFAIAQTACTPQQVWVSPTAPLNATEPPGTLCNLTQLETSVLWSCPPLTNTFFVVAITLETQPRCVFNAVQDFFPACGVFGTTNPFVSGTWRAPAYRQPYFYQQQSSVYFAPYGSAFQPCHCGPNNNGRRCGGQVSALRFTGSTYVHTMCGEDTWFPRGALVVDDAQNLALCKCNPLAGTQSVNANLGVLNGASDESFTGPACSWQIVFNQERGQLMLGNGHGRCVAPQMPYGMCDFAVAEYEADALWTPFITAPGQIILQNTHEFVARPSGDPRFGGGDSRSVVTVSQSVGAGSPAGLIGSWLLPSGQYAVVQNVLNTMGYVCGQTVRVPVQANFTLGPVALSPPFPVRAVATVTIWTLVPNTFQTLTSVETCDPGLTFAAQNGAAQPCSTQNYCPSAWVALGYIDVASVQSSSYVQEPQEHTCIAYATWSQLQPTQSYDFTGSTLWINLECSASVFLQQDSANATSNLLRFPTLNCANAVHRVVDVGWWVRFASTLGYILQCASQPIAPYAYTIGAAFGLMYNQIPNLQFPLDPNLLKPAHYNITASLYNYVRAYDSSGTPLDNDIITEETLDYYLLGLAPDVNLTSAPATPFSVLVVNGTLYVSSAQPAVMNLSQAGPPRSTWLNFHSMGVPWVAWDVVEARPNNWLATGANWTTPPWLAQQFVDVVWSAWALQTSQGQPLDGLTQQNFGARAFAAIAAFPTLSLPGVWQSAPGFLATLGTVVTVTFVANLTVFQMWRSDGTLCGTQYNVVAGTNGTFLCSTAPAPGSAPPLAQYMSSLYAAFNPAAAAALAGTLNDVLNATGTTFSEEATDDWIGVHFRSVPADFNLVVSGDGASTTWDNAYNTFATQFFDQPASQSRWAAYQIPPTKIFYQQYQQTSQQVIDNLVEQIVVEHQWPHNPFAAAAQAAAVAQGGFLRPYDFVGSYSDRIALRNAWLTLWPPFQCTEDYQCQAFSRNGGTKCSYDIAAVPYRPWRNGDPNWAYAPLSLGDEGGCEGYRRFDKGFWVSQTFNRQPISGYGPANVAYWLEAVNWQRTMQRIYPDLAPTGPLFDELVEPFATLLALQGDALIDAMNTTMGASLPWDTATSAGICSGGGTVRVQQQNYTRVLTVFPQQNPQFVRTPACTWLVLNATQRFALQTPQTPNVMVYASVNTTDTLSIQYGTPYLTQPSQNVSGSLGVLTGCAVARLQPVGCIANFAGVGITTLDCENDALFGTGAYLYLQDYFAESVSTFVVELSPF